MSEKEQIEKLKEVALKPVVWNTDYDARKSAVEAIAAYGDAAIPALIEVGQKANASVQKYALDSIAKIKAQAKMKEEAKRHFP